MRFYAHRGNTRGPSPMFENQPHYLAQAIADGFECEVDIWCVQGDLKFGHDWPDYYVPEGWMDVYAKHCIFHCKNWEAMLAMTQDLQHFFWHQEDAYTLTSTGLVWVYPEVTVPNYKNFIACDPSKVDLPNAWSDIYGVCSDYVHQLRLQEEALCPKK